MSQELDALRRRLYGGVDDPAMRIRDFIADFIAGPDTRGQVIAALKSILDELEEDQREDLEDAEGRDCFCNRGEFICSHDCYHP